MTEHVHRWARVEEALIHEFALYLVGQSPRPNLQRVPWGCRDCRALLCTGELPTRRGSVFACRLVLGHAGPCANPHIPPDQDYRPPRPPLSPSPVPATPAPLRPRVAAEVTP